MTGNDVVSDERTVSVSHKGGYYAYVVMSWLLVSVLAVRELQPGWAASGTPLDVLLVLGGGALTHLGYTFLHRATSARAIRAVLMSVVLAVIVAAVLVFGLTRH